MCLCLLYINNGTHFILIMVILWLFWFIVTLTVLQKKKGPLVKVSKLPAGVLPGTDYNQLTFTVNKLREHWHKGQNAVLFDDQVMQ